MMPIRNIHKILVAVLFTAGLGLLLMGAQTGHRVLVSAAGWGVSSGEDSDLALSGGIGVKSVLTGEGELVQIGKKNLVETAHLLQIHKEGAALSGHKRPLNRHRSRFGLDGFCASFITIDHPHFGNKALPDVSRPGVFATILTGSSLRGPPCA
jgi:hypothetical protein